MKTRYDGHRPMKAQRGQVTVEFALISIMLIGLILVIIDLTRAGFTQHNLDSGTSDLARSLATISSTNSISSTTVFSPTALNPASGYTTTQLPSALAHAAAISSNAFSSSPALTMTGAMTLSNGVVTVVATPDLTNTTEITVSVTRAFTPAVGIFLNHAIFHLSAASSALTAAGQ